MDIRRHKVSGDQDTPASNDNLPPETPPPANPSAPRGEADRQTLRQAVATASSALAQNCRVLEGDNLFLLRALADNSVDSVVTDPPYGLTFMGKKWDHDVPTVEFWQEVYRVLKPGGYVLSFGGTRTYHRMVVAIEDAGFNIVDQISWLYGQGFPKSRNLSKDIDRILGAEREVVGRVKMPGYQAAAAKHGVQTVNVTEHDVFSDDPITKEAKHFQGYGTALKPAQEPICVARKPHKGSIAKNVLEHGVGGLNIDACRVGTEGGTTRSHQGGYGAAGRGKSWRSDHDVVDLGSGRWPANVIHDGSSDAFPGQFFYCAKPSMAEKGDTSHITVKPVALMRYLVKLVTPAGGVVLDPFAGSGTTGVAAAEEGLRAILMERDPTYVADIRRRVARYAPICAPVTYASVCTGVDALTLAWEPLGGFEPIFSSEIDPFASKVLDTHWPHIPNLGDMTNINSAEFAGKIDVLWGSTPCQTYSRAGDRAGLDDPRGALTRTFVDLIDQIGPKVAILENVKGILSDETNAFGCFLSALSGEPDDLQIEGGRWPSEGAYQGPTRRVAWRVCEAFDAGLPQYRGRVFVVGCPIDGPDPRQLLPDPQGQGWNADPDAPRDLQAVFAGSLGSVVAMNADATPKCNDKGAAYCFRASQGSGGRSLVIVDGEVREMTPQERERAMGWPWAGDHTDIPGATTVQRQRVIGNSLAIPHVRDMGTKIMAALADEKMYLPLAA